MARLARGGTARRTRGTRLLAALRTPLGASSAVLLGVVLLLAVFAPVLWSARASAIGAGAILQGPSAAHWLGTNDLGQDIFYRVLVATRLSVGLALAATGIGIACGLVLGTAPVIVGRRAGRAITAVVNVAVAFPALLLALFFAVIFGVGARGALLAIGFASAPSFARLVRTLTASVAGLDYIAAARIAGVGRLRLLTRHVLPNIGDTLIVNATMASGDALLSFAGLSFLGLGVQAPSYDWGQLLSDGLQGIYTSPAAALAPGVAIVVAGLAFNLFGETLAVGLGAGASSRARSQRVERLGLGLGWLRGPRGSAPAGRSNLPSRPSAELTGPGSTVLAVSGLSVSFPGGVRAVRGVSFSLRRGEAVGVVGESGSGKSLTALAIAQLLEHPAQVSADRLELLGHDLGPRPPGRPSTSGSAPGGYRMSGRELRRFLGTKAGFVFQDPMTSFNPVQRVGAQLAEVAAEHHGMSREAAAARSVDRLRAVHIPRPERRARQFPHELSGGMRQRAMIGMAMMGEPALVIADEPTTALDVTVQRRVLQLLKSIQARGAGGGEMALLFISHDITVVGQVCDRVLVMYAGRIVENLPAADLRTHARHPYTRALLAAVPSMQTRRELPLAVIPGRPADPADLPAGCAYAARCAFADAQCRAADPELAADDAGRQVACWHADRVPAGEAA
ncbi:MAG TPA: dipeptide/oligopeptide/nickel ABC transporter permease/ATP-binding protein [Trebonia sp.]|nr:dipeptide/oligopeptide/nickel ABC transporter permease/ATP-binding protein [Trebonia sp.]